MKTRTITQPMLNNIKTVLTRMNEKTKYADDGYSFATEILKRLTIGDKAEFIDGRCFINKVAPDKQMQKHTLFTMGKTQLVINNKSGEIVDYYKPFYKPWKKVMKNLEKYLQIFSDNFDNPQIVTQHRLSFSGFTKAGLQKIQEIKDKINL